MKKSLIIVIIILIGLNQAHAQISTKKKANKMISSMSSFEGTRNYLGENVHQYIGQELYLTNNPMSVREFGYTGFIHDYTRSLCESSNTSFQRHDSHSLNSEYEKLAGRYFLVLDVIKHPKADSDSLYKNKSFFKLKAKDNGDIVYYEYISDNEASFPFIVVDFFQRKKKEFVGKDYFLKQYSGHYYWEEPTDINTGHPIYLSFSTIWKCIDFVVEEELWKLALILENKNGEQLLIYLDMADGRYGYSWIVEKSQVELYQKIYGAQNWRLILSGEVKLGMTKEMCTLSWGTPYEINKIISKKVIHEQWVYRKKYSSDRYLYFENDKLTAIL